jgi:hypothetical protein
MQPSPKRLADRYPQLRAEPQFAEMLGPAAAAAREAAPAVPRAPGGPAGAPAGEQGAAALRPLRTFAESYLPKPPRFGTAAEIEHVLGRVADALETFGRSFLELQRGYEEFGKEMGVRTVQAEGPLQRARDVRQLLAYVLDAKAQGRSAELQRAWSSLAVEAWAIDVVEPSENPDLGTDLDIGLEDWSDEFVRVALPIRMDRLRTRHVPDLRAVC